MSEPILVGRSSAIKSLRAFIRTAANSDVNVIILGETGVGKELTARAIHYESCRRRAPFIKINCANLSDTLLESELFGHKKGSFTGALFDRPGLLEEAEGGVFFFDEIGDITPYIQAKLLDLVEDKRIRRVGENIFRRIDVRFIFATNRDLYRLVLMNKFRRDLFYRICVLSVCIPPLRERIDDIPLLADLFLKREVLKRKANIDIASDAIEKLSTYSFPGNIRELENVIIRACVLATGNIINKKDISFVDRMHTHKLASNERIPGNISNTITECSGNKSKAAKRLGISRVHLYRLLKNERADQNLQ